MSSSLLHDLCPKLESSYLHVFMRYKVIYRIVGAIDSVIDLDV